MAKQTNVQWQQIDVTTLPSTLGALYHDYKASYTQMKIDREEFEKAMREAIVAPAGKRAAFGYNFGKLSIAFVDDDKPTTKAGSAISLASLTK